jgi:alpha-tubulin suppressor-like RCC1 family protein
LVLASAGAVSLDLDASTAAGGLYTTAILHGGVVWTAGENSQMTIGVTPVVGLGRLRHAALTNVVSVGHGLYHVVAVTSGGAVYAWGNNGTGVFGGTSPSSSNVPVQMTGWQPAVAVAAGREQTYVLDGVGRVWAVGENSSGELGDGSFIDRTSPVLVSGLGGVFVVAISAGSQHAIALDSNGDVWAWGRGNEGQLGDGLQTTSNVPVQVSGLKAGAIAAGGFHNLALNSGTVYAWGQNSHGQIGDNTNFQRNTPVTVIGPLGSSVTSIAAGHTHSLAVTSANTVLGWGGNGTYQLGLGHAGPVLQPVTIPGPTGITSVGAGTHSSFAFAGDGRVFGWGDNEFGRLGDGIYNWDRKESLDLAIAGGFWRVPSPDFSRWTPGAGNITITHVLGSTPGLTMTYTTNGADPTLGDPAIASGFTIAVTSGTTLKVRAFLSGSPDSGVSTAVY